MHKSLLTYSQILGKFLYSVIKNCLILLINFVINRKDGGGDNTDPYKT